MLRSSPFCRIDRAHNDTKSRTLSVSEVLDTDGRRIDKVLIRRDVTRGHNQTETDGPESDI
jgi:CBS domain containing-hemolysin-like protein